MPGCNRRYRARLACRVTPWTLREAREVAALARAAGIGHHWNDALGHALALARADLCARLARRGIDPDQVIVEALQRREPDRGMTWHGADAYAPDCD